MRKIRMIELRNLRSGPERAEIEGPTYEDDDGRHQSWRERVGTEITIHRQGVRGRFHADVSMLVAEGYFSENQDDVSDSTTEQA